MLHSLDLIGEEEMDYFLKSLFIYVCVLEVSSRVAEHKMIHVCLSI
jgi:hypothetical protein